MSRIYAAGVAGLATWAFGLLTVFSFNIWADFKPLFMIPVFEDYTVFDLLDYLTANIMMPVSGLLLALFVGWMIKPEAIREELNIQNPKFFNSWFWLLRWVAPISIALILYSSL